MKILMKILFGGLAAIVAISLVLALIVMVVFDPEDYRDAMTELVSEQTGRKAEIDELPSLKLFPCCGVRLAGMRLGSLPGFSDQAFASIDVAEVGLQLWPLITRQEVRVNAIHLDGLQLNLERRKDASVNWEFETAAAEPAVDSGEDSPAVDMADFSVAGITVSNAGITWKDAQAGTEFSIEGLSLETGEIAAGSPFDLRAGFDAIDVASGDRATVMLTGNVRFDPEPARIELRDLRLDNTVKAPAAGLAELSAAITAGSIAIDPQAQRTTLKELVAQIEAAGVKLEVTGSGEVSEQDTRLAGTVAVQPFSPREVLASMAASPDGEPAIVTTADPEALAQASAGADWSLTADRLDLSALVLELDQTKISGEFTVRNFDQPDYRFELIADELDLDRYMSPVTETDSEAADTSTVTDLDLPTDFLRQLRLSGDLGVQRLQANGLQLTDLQAKIGAAKGVISLDPVSAALYGGQYAGRIVLDVTGDVASLSLSQKITAVQASPLLTDLMSTSSLDGLMEARIDATARGNTDLALRKSLAGTVGFSLADGIYQGMDIWHEIRVARARLKGEPPPESSGKQQTEITELEITGRMAQGVLTSDRMNIQIPFIRLTGGGTADLVDQDLDFTLKARVFEKPEFADGEDLGDLMGVSIPITISGAAEDPDIRVDLGDAVKQWAVKKLSERLMDRLGPAPDAAGDQGAGDATPDQQEEKPRDAAKRLLRGLFDPQ